MTDTDRIFLAMTDYFAGDPRRIQHFTKVHAYAALIADGESMSGIRRREILEAAMHARSSFWKPPPLCTT